jgi:hypothetical protein
VDAQVDFHEKDMTGVDAAVVSQRVASFILENIDDIDEVFVTMDSRYRYHIASSLCWKAVDNSGNDISPLEV